MTIFFNFKVLNFVVVSADHFGIGKVTIKSLISVVRKLIGPKYLSEGSKSSTHYLSDKNRFDVSSKGSSESIPDDVVIHYLHWPRIEINICRRHCQQMIYMDLAYLDSGTNRVNLLFTTPNDVSVRRELKTETQQLLRRIKKVKLEFGFFSKHSTTPVDNCGSKLWV